MNKYIKYILIGLTIDVLIYAAFTILSSTEYAKSIAIIVFPLALWSARIIVAFQIGVVTRRLPMLDGGEVRESDFWSFNPDVYIRKPGFDYFKGYLFKEVCCCLLLWALFVSPAIMKVLSDRGFNV